MSAAQQKLESKMSIARDIQMSMVPPPRRIVAPESGLSLDVHAALEPHKAVGGDFYGFYDNDGVVWLGIGDVSDKGVPAKQKVLRGED